MKAALTPAYGSADVLVTRDVPRPAIGPHDVLIEVRSSIVTAGDLRLRAADFPSFTSVVGRFVIGLFRPKHAVQGTMFAGRIVAVGSAVTRYAIGDDVFGSTMHGAYAEYLAMPADGSMARIPAGVGYDEAASVPYGAATALKFLRDLGSVKPGDEVLILGASGGVGRFAVQLAKHLGAKVTAVASRRAADLVRDLGADHFIDHDAEDFTQNGRRYDVIFDVAGATTFSRARSSLTEDGRYLTLTISVGILWHMAATAMIGGRRAKWGVHISDRQDLEELHDLLARGVVRPLIAERFPLERIAEAHASAETRRPHGSVVVAIA